MAYQINAPSPSPGAYTPKIVFSTSARATRMPRLDSQRALLELFSPSLPPLASPDLCGTVSQVVAPYKDSTTVPAGTANMELPLPHSHGTAVQYIDDPGQDKQFTCPDVDTCDQETNPACLPGSANYPLGGNTVSGSTQNPFSSSNPVQISRNPRREQRCAADPTFFYCTVQSVPCEGSVEVISYYDGTAAVRAFCISWRRKSTRAIPRYLAAPCRALSQTMTLYDEGTYNGVTPTSWQNGINLSTLRQLTPKRRPNFALFRSSSNTLYPRPRSFCRRAYVRGRLVYLYCV